MKEIEFGHKIKVYTVEEFDVTEDNLASVFKKRKNWSAPGVDEIQNNWWKKFKRIWKLLFQTMKQRKCDGLSCGMDCLGMIRTIT